MGYTFTTDAPQCPHCNEKQEHDGEFFFDEDLTEYPCDHCGKAFKIEVSTQTSWTCTTPTKEPNQ